MINVYLLLDFLPYRQIEIIYFGIGMLGPEYVGTIKYFV